MTFREWLHTEPVRSPVVALIGEREWPSFAREVEKYAQRNPSVTLCDRASLVDAIVECASFGVPMGEAFIKAKRTIGDKKPEAVAILGYHGKVRLLKHHQIIIDIKARCVYENDLIRITDGTSPEVVHTFSPDLLSRGTLVGGWCKCYTSRRFTHLVVMHRSEIDEIRQTYSDDYGDGDLEEFARWYIPKTLIHQMEKVIQIPQRLRAAVPSDEFDRVAAGGVRAPAPTLVVAPEPDAFVEMQNAQAVA